MPNEQSRANWSAETLRLEILQGEMAEMAKKDAARQAEEKRRADFAADFLRHHIGPEELRHIRQLIEAAVRHGELQTLIYSFPSALCLDEGRAINNARADWPDTLQGKAREIYDTFERHARPLGYRLHASIINFPDGIPGDVGFFLSWAPSATLGLDGVKKPD